MRGRWLEVTLFIGVVVVLGQMWVPSFAEASLQKESCRELYRTSRFKRAAECFVLFYRKTKKPQALLNAAQSYRRVASFQTNVSEKRYWLERAVVYFRRYVRLVPAEKQWTMLQIRKLLVQIGYSHLTLTTKPSAASLDIQGYRFSRKAKSPYKGYLRPGAYTIRIRTSQQKEKVIKLTFRRYQRIKREVDLRVAKVVSPSSLVRPRRPQASGGSKHQFNLKTFTKVKKKKVRAGPVASLQRKVTPKPWSKTQIGLWSVFGTGGALTISGLLFLGLSVTNSNQLADRNLSSLEAQRFANAANQQRIAGGVQIGVGAAFLTAGFIWYAILVSQESQEKKKTKLGVRPLPTRQRRHSGANPFVHRVWLRSVPPPKGHAVLGLFGEP